MATNPGQKQVGRSGSLVFWFTITAAVYICFTAAIIVHKRPWVDEGWFTSPALNLVTHGSFGTLLLDPAGSHLAILKRGLVLRGINQHTYWVMPLYLLQLAIWGKLFGFSVFSIRIPSLLWGIVTLMSVWIVIRRFYPRHPFAAVVGTAMLAVDFGFVSSATDGRMDMTCLGLGLAGLAAYLSLREISLSRAFFVSHSLTAAGCMTHPFGVFAVVTLVFTMMYLDRDRLRPSAALWIAAPYALGGAILATWAAQYPSDFFTQFTANSAGRVRDILMPWRSVWNEIYVRFLDHYWRSESLMGKVRMVGLVLSAGAITLLITARELRGQKWCRLLLWLILIRFLLLSLLGNPKYEHYIVHIVPYFAIATGIAFSYLWAEQRAAIAAGTTSATRAVRYRTFCAGLLALYFASQTAVMIHRAFILSTYQKDYRPLIAYLQANTRPDDLIVGSAELGFGLGFYNPHLADDVWLGYWSGRRPSIVVVDKWYYGGVFEGAGVKDFPEPNYFTTEFKRRFYKLKQIGGYTVYRRYQGG